jgi:hypothetical protein
MDDDAVVDMHQLSDTRAYCFKDVNQVLRELGTSHEGLTIEEVLIRLES